MRYIATAKSVLIIVTWVTLVAVAMHPSIKRTVINLQLLHYLSKIPDVGPSVAQDALDRVIRDGVGSDLNNERLCSRISDATFLEASPALRLDYAVSCPRYVDEAVLHSACRNPVECLLLGILLYENGRRDEAVKTWQTVNADVFFYGCYARPTHLSSRSVCVDLASRISPTDSRYAWALAMQYLGDRAPTETTLQAFQQVRALAPRGTYHSSMAQGFVGYLQLDAHTALMGFGAARDGAQTDAERGVALAWIGRVHLYVSKDYTIAVEFLEESTVLAPSLWAYTEIGLAYELAGMNDSAERHYKTAWGLYPDEIVPTQAYARFQWKQGHCQDAVTTLKTILREAEINTVLDDFRRVYPDKCLSFGSN